jgi:hypothetical protein
MTKSVEGRGSAESPLPCVRAGELGTMNLRVLPVGVLSIPSPAFAGHGGYQRISYRQRRSCTTGEDDPERKNAVTGPHRCRQADIYTCAKPPSANNSTPVT